ncbi:MAG: polyribonucleotide nucleotidyltransferase [Planctomycetota bacterium]
MVYFKVEGEIAGKKITIETGKMAKQADGAVLVTMEGTVVLVAAQSDTPRMGLDFFPLTVDYRERTAAAGKFPGGFIKREGRPTQKEILTSRLIDRHIRPLFPEGFHAEVQVQCIVLSADQQNDPDLLSMIGASAALSISKIPFMGPTGAARVGFTNNAFKIYPTHNEMEMSQLELVVAGTENAVCMVEAGARELSEDQMLEAIKVGHEHVKQVIALINQMVSEVGVPKVEFVAPERNEALWNELVESYQEPMRKALCTSGKMERSAAIHAFTASLVETKTASIADEDERVASERELKNLIHDLAAYCERKMIVEENRRIDGRGLTEVRPIDVELGLLPRTHGSALFTRGETQALVTVTLGTASDEQIVDGLKEEYSKKFMLDYNFPPFSVGECRPIRGPGRREIGHGALAERALLAVLPDPEVFSYTMRVISDILESNGSSSMATVCGGTLAMLDGGVALLRPVAGIAMGLIVEGDEVRVLTDILGSEDHNGDMDFKVAGTGMGITALQMDIKVAGISFDIMHKALEQAKEGRKHILRRMMEFIDSPREDLSPFAPRLIRKQINPDKIGALIGPGGKNIKMIQEQANVNIEVDNDGVVLISGPNRKCVEEGLAMVEGVTDEVEVGRIYAGKVVSIKDFGAFMEVLPGQEGLCHVSELAEEFVKTVSDVVKIGEVYDVKVINVDDSGRIKLSRKQALKDKRN